ncbi:MAG: FKBP-type peptidyl-prolyl cis-trans isomerase [Chitinophagaceae bacterium]|nr:FKBP-type peptidyl-prolyl cis-trans isomerase [Chitinophagaceae bacterium]
MKKIVVLSGLCVFSVGLFAQVKKKPVTAAKPKPAVAQVVMKNSLDSFSYAMGLSIANFYKEQGVQNINNNLVLKALNDMKAGKPLMDDAQANTCMVNYVQETRGEKAAGNKKAGQAFLAENKKQPGVNTLPSGLQYQVLKEGAGVKPAATDKVKVHYTGSLLDGFVFDSSVQRGEPLEIAVNGVIPGWIEALQLMPVGSKWKLFIPSHLAYGDNGAGAAIKPGSTLIFEVELLDIVK